MKDSIFKSEERCGKFVFDERVAGVFDDMLSRSIPFYDETQKMIAGIAADYYQKGTKIYDLGCSTGATILNLCSVIDDPDLKIVGIDSSAPILEKGYKKITDRGLEGKIDLVTADITEAEITNPSVVIMNYTLQFIQPGFRGFTIKRIFDALNEGGILIMSDKVLEKDELISSLFIEKHHAYKKMMGYSDMEIAKKREALSSVLIPSTIEEEYDLLAGAGFESIAILFKWFNFASFLALKI